MTVCATYDGQYDCDAASLPLLQLRLRLEIFVVRQAGRRQIPLNSISAPVTPPCSRDRQLHRTRQVFS
jgi:hypothetical protein